MFQHTCRLCGTEFTGPARRAGCPACKEKRSNGPYLTQREQQIVGLVCEGHANKEIAARCGLATESVKVYLSKIFRRLHVGNRVELALLFLRTELERTQRERDEALMRLVATKSNDTVVHLVP